MAKYGGFGGFGGGNNMQSLMKQAQKMQEEALKAKEEVENSEHEGKASGGLVTVVVNGNGQLKKVKLDSSLEGEDLEMIEDLIMAAYNTAKQSADKQKDNALGGFGGLI